MQWSLPELLQCLADCTKAWKARSAPVMENSEKHHLETRPNLVAFCIFIVGTILTWLMMDTAQLFFLPALHLYCIRPCEGFEDPSYSRSLGKQVALVIRFYWSKRLRLSPEMAAATLLVGVSQIVITVGKS